MIHKYLLHSVKIDDCPNGCHGYLRIIQLLIDKGANLNAVDRNGYSVLDVMHETGDKYEGTFER